MNRKQSYIVIAILFIASSLAPQTISAAPKPSQLASAKSVFISSAFGEGSFGPGEYDYFYAAIQKLGHFSVVGTPHDADLILEIGNGDGYQSMTLRIFDPQTHTLLWFVSRVSPVGNNNTTEKNRLKAMDQLATDLQRVTAPSPTKTN